MEGMSEHWNCFLDTLPSSMNDYIRSHAGDNENFIQLEEESCFEQNHLAFVSKETGLEIHLFRDLYGSYLSIWYLQAEKNNEDGDPTYTDHEIQVDSPFAILSDIA